MKHCRLSQLHISRYLKLDINSGYLKCYSFFLNSKYNFIFLPDVHYQVCEWRARRPWCFRYLWLQVHPRGRSVSQPSRHFILCYIVQNLSYLILPGVAFSVPREAARSTAVAMTVLLSWPPSAPCAMTPPWTTTRWERDQQCGKHLRCPSEWCNLTTAGAFHSPRRSTRRLVRPLRLPCPAWWRRWTCSTPTWRTCPELREPTLAAPYVSVTEDVLLVDRQSASLVKCPNMNSIMYFNRLQWRSCFLLFIASSKKGWQKTSYISSTLFLKVMQAK